MHNVKLIGNFRTLLLIGAYTFVMIFLTMNSNLYISADVRLEKSFSADIHDEVYDEPIQIHTYGSDKKLRAENFFEKPQRVITVGRNNLESMLYLQETDRLIASEGSRQSFKNIGLVKKYNNLLTDTLFFDYGIPDLEAVLYLQPDLILGWRSTFSPKYLRSTDWWAQRGVHTYISATSNHTAPVGTIDDEIQYMKDMGRIFHKEDEVAVYLQHLQEYLDRLAAFTSDKPKKTVAVIEGNGRNITNYDPHWLVGDLIKRCHGEMPIASSRISAEELLMVNPDVIFVVTFSEHTESFVAQLLHDPKFHSLRAVSTKQVYPIPLYLMYTTGFSTMDGLDLIAQGMYPQWNLSNREEEQADKM